MKKLLLLCCLTGGMILFTGCSSVGITPQDEEEIVVIPDIVRLGVIAPLAGPGASYGNDVVAVVSAIVDVFNSTHDSVYVELVVEDGKCNGKDATSAARKLIDIDMVSVIIGGVCSSETLAAGKIAQEAGILMLAPGSASSNISDIGDWIVRSNNNSNAAEALNYAIKGNYKEITVVKELKDYPADMSDRFVDGFRGEIQVIELAPDETDSRAVAKQIASFSQSEALFIFTQSEATSIPLFLALEEEGLLSDYKGHIYGANTLLVPAFLEKMGSVVDGVQEVNVAIPVNENMNTDPYFASVAQHTILGDGFTFLQAVDYMLMLIPAREAGYTTSEQMKQVIYDFSDEFPFEGYLGNYRFDEQGDAVAIEFSMYAARDGVSVMTDK